MSDSLIRQDAEAALLGSLILNSEQISAFTEKLSPDMFGLQSHRTLWERILALHAGGTRINLVVLKEALPKECLESVGGVGYLGSLITGIGDQPSAEPYFKVVEEYWIRRKYRDRAEKLKLAAESAPVLEEVHKEADEIKLQSAKLSLPTISDAAEDAIVRVATERKTGVDLSFGIRPLDELLGGIRRGKLYTLGGWTSHGKTTVATNIILNNLKNNDKCKIIYSGFENIEDIPLKLASLDSGRPLSHFTNPSSLKSDDDLENVQQSLMGLSRFKDRLILVSGAGPGRLKQICREYCPDLVFLDYVQRCAALKANNDEQGLRHAVGRVAAEMQDISLEFKCASFSLSQLKRAGEDFKGPRVREPELSDLKESGELENYSDFVIFAWWPWRMTMQDNKWRQVDYRFPVKKNKTGPCLTVHSIINLENLQIK